MPRTFDPVFTQALLARETSAMVLTLLDITHPEMDEDIRIVNNIEGVWSLGHWYTPVGFDCILPEERDGTPRAAKISIDNTTQWFTPILRQMQSAFDCTIKIALGDPSKLPMQVFNNIEIEYMPMQLIAVQWDDTTAVFTLSYENLANEQWPPQSFNPFDFPGLFDDYIIVRGGNSGFGGSDPRPLRQRDIDARNARRRREKAAKRR